MGSTFTRSRYQEAPRFFPGILAVLLLIGPSLFAGVDSAMGCHDERLNKPQPFHFTMQGNPLVRHRSATDPDVHVWDGRVWMYCSQDHPKQEGDKGVYARMDGYHVYSSEDLINWIDHGEILHSRDVDWGLDGWMWAPGVARKEGKYHLFYPHKDKQGTWRIGLAISDRPTGPFQDIGHPIAGLRGIDPMVLIDDDGEAYLYYNMDDESYNFNNSTRVVRLKPDLRDIAERPRKIDYAPTAVLENLELRFLEGAFVHKKDGRYYFSYTNWQNKTHQGFYAVGESPYGPFEWKGPMAPKPDGAQDHHSIIRFNDNWYYFYHVGGAAWKPEGYTGSRRIACYDRLEYAGDGSIKMVEHTTGSLPAKP
jgi:beta-xylosidase